MEKITIDAMGVIDAIRHQEVLIYIHETYNIGRYSFVFSNRIKEDVIKVLMREYGYNETDARNEFESFRASLNGRVESYNENDKAESDKLIKKYESWNCCHYPDSLIIAHSKRLGIRKGISRDGGFKKVAIAEGIEITHMPTLEAIINQKFRMLYGHRH